MGSNAVAARIKVMDHLNIAERRDLKMSHHRNVSEAWIGRTTNTLQSVDVDTEKGGLKTGCWFERRAEAKPPESARYPSKRLNRILLHANGDLMILWPS